MNKIWIKLLVALSLLPVATIAGAQMVPDNEQILAKTLDAASPFNYTSLMMRYKAGDMTMTIEDYHYLYYGYAFREEYQPLNAIPAESRILAIFDASETPDLAGMEKIIEYGKEVMEADPFSPRNLNFLAYAYGAIGDTVNESINFDRFLKVSEVIEASGNGLKEGTPKHILRFEHAADVLNAQGLAINKRMVVSRTVEYIALEKRDSKGSKGYYFDFSRVYWKKPENMERPKRNWEMYTPPPTGRK